MLFPTPARLFSFVTALALFAGCSGSSPRAGFDDAPKVDTTGNAPEAPSTSFGGGGGEPAVSGDGCSAEAKLVYVLSLEGDIYSFAPAEKKFTKIGPLNCNASEQKPVSMAVDRNAVAWVNMQEPHIPGMPGDFSVLHKFDIKSKTCTPTKLKGNFGGMGFSTNEGSTDQETLFVMANTVDGYELATVDVTTEAFKSVGILKERVGLELTGTGDGRLYGFLFDQPLSFARVDKKTTALSERYELTKVEQPRDPMFAFSFWGGDFFFYTATAMSAAKTSNVTRYRPSDGSLDTAYMKNVGFHIVGAGVSTCAPTAAPR